MFVTSRRIFVAIAEARILTKLLANKIVHIITVGPYPSARYLASIYIDPRLSVERQLVHVVDEVAESHEGGALVL